MITQKKFPISVREMCERYEKLQSADVYDVLDQSGFGLGNQCLSLGIKPLLPSMVVAGPAFTVKGQQEVRDYTEMERPKIDNFGMFRAIYQDCVVVLNGEKEPQIAPVGAIMSRGWKNQGARGMVVDGSTRDGKDVITIPNWAAFVRNCSPIEARGRWAPNDCMVPIAMPGTLSAQVKVNPYDWVLGDWDAVIVIPQEIAYEVLLKAEALAAVEAKSKADLVKGDSIWDVHAKYKRL